MLPQSVRDRLARGHAVGAELPSSREGMRAFVVVVPRVPDPHKYPEAWVGLDGVPPRLTIQLKDPRSIRGYEVRYLEHDAKYTDEHWGWDYDTVLADATTRVRRAIVLREADLPDALAPWLRDLTQLGDPLKLDSALATSPIEWYLEQSERYPHLTQ